MFLSCMLIKFPITGNTKMVSLCFTPSDKNTLRKNLSLTFFAEMLLWTVFKALSVVLSGRVKISRRWVEMKANGEWEANTIIAGLVHLVQVSLIASLELERVQYFDPVNKWNNMNVREGSILVLESKEWIFFFFFSSSKLVKLLVKCPHLEQNFSVRDRIHLLCRKQPLFRTSSSNLDISQRQKECECSPVVVCLLRCSRNVFVLQKHMSLEGRMAA